jgi:DNA-binding transcriptional ArsR family regulator
MTNRAQAKDLEPIWKALANPLRREMLDALSDGPLTTGELDALFPDYSRFAVMQHLRVLEHGGLVGYRRRGRERFNYLNPVPIQQIYHRWVSRYQQPWAEALTSLKVQLESPRDEAAGKRRRRKRA